MTNDPAAATIARDHAPPAGATAALVFASGDVVWGRGCGATGTAVGELCFNTAMTGYQEIMTDPSYAGQVITFTFPHIGNVGANDEDIEHGNPHALGCILREPITPASNFRSMRSFNEWLQSYGRIGLSGADTRAITRRVRLGGPPDVALTHQPDGRIDVAALQAQARGWGGLEGLDLARDVWTRQSYDWTQGLWAMHSGYPQAAPDASAPLCVVLDYGVKRNILRNLVSAGFRVKVVPGDSSAADVMARQPDAIFLSNGPGDPAATGQYAIPVIRELVDSGKPLFGICLGHQMLGLAAGARTYKMLQGHRGANHPVREQATGKVEITSMNHGFAVEAESLPAGVEATHLSLFDGTLCGLKYAGKPVFSVQHHPEASPGPQDSFYLFRQFRELVGHA